MVYLPMDVCALKDILDKYITSVQFRLACCAGQKKIILQITPFIMLRKCVYRPL